MSRQLIRFLLANTLAAGINISVHLFFGRFLLDFLSVFLGFLAGLGSSYYLCRGFVFHSTRKTTLSEASRFVLVNCVMLLITWFVYQASLQWLEAFWGALLSEDMIRTAAHAFGVAAPVFFSFVAQKTFTFKQRL